MRMLIIRPFEGTDADYEAVINIEMANWPEYPSSIEVWKHADKSRDPNYLYHRDVIKKDGQIVAWAYYGQWGWAFHPDKYAMTIRVHPDYQRQGIGTAYLEHLMALLAERNPLALTGETREDKAHSLAFLRKHGFEQVMRYPRSLLDTTTFDETNFAGILEKVRQSGIKIVNLRELVEIDPDWKRKQYELECELNQDVPSPDPVQKRTLDLFEKQTLNHPRLLPSGWFVALDGDKHVGSSNLWKRIGTKEYLDTGLTGVVRSHRQRGIATALKVHAIAFAKAYGAKQIETDNEENNPMYLLNMKLGFKPAAAWVDFQKKLREEA